jgi:hypothetical protein
MARRAFTTEASSVLWTICQGGRTRLSQSATSSASAPRSRSPIASMVRWTSTDGAAPRPTRPPSVSTSTMIFDVPE